MNPQLSPELTRREGVRALPVRLADGQEWGLALPTTQFEPRFRDSGEDGQPIIEVLTCPGYAPAIETQIRKLALAFERGDSSGRTVAFLGVASSLLRLAHNLTVQESIPLLIVPRKEIPRLVRETLAVICSRAVSDESGREVESSGI